MNTKIMTQPLGYYTSYTPGNGSYLEVIQRKYGDYLQGLNKREKLFLIKRIGYQLTCEITEPDIRLEELSDLLSKVKILPLSDRLGMIRCLAEGVNL